MIPISAAPANAATLVLGELVDIGGAATHIELDEAAGLAYVSIEGKPKIAVVDLATKTLLEKFTMGSPSQGLSLSADGSKLYVAYHSSGHVVEVDTATGTILRTFDIRLTMSSDGVFDVVVIGDHLYATPTENGSIARIDLTSGAKSTVAAGYDFGGAPRLIWGGTDSLYVSLSFSPNDLFRLDLTDPLVPVVAETAHADIDGSAPSIVAAGGTRIISAGGQQLDAATLEVVGSVPEGVPATAGGGSTVFFAEDHGSRELRIRRFNLTTNNATGAFDTTCGRDSGDAADLKVLPGNSVFAAATDDGLCVVDFAAAIPQCDGLDATLLGSATDDILTGTSGDDVIVALSGDDTIDGGGGNDRICAGTGDDTVVPDGGDNYIDGGPGTDSISFAGSPTGVDVDLASGEATGYGTSTIEMFENLTGSQLPDVLKGNGSPNTIFGLSGNDIIVGRRGADFLRGGNGDDILKGGGGPDRLWGEANFDLIIGGGGDDDIRGGSGNKDAVSYAGAAGPVIASLKAGSATGEGTDSLIGVEQLIGSDYDDELTGDAAPNYLFGGLGKDTLTGLKGEDVIDGWKGKDSLFGGSGDDLLAGYTGDDELVGGPGDDALGGENGDDTISGKSGNDRLDGGAGIDDLSGGTGTDTCSTGESYASCETLLDSTPAADGVAVSQRFEARLRRR